MAEQEPNFNFDYEKQSSTAPTTPSLGQRAIEVLNEQKWKIGAAVVLGGPFAAGIIQGLVDPRDILAYGILQLMTIGAANSPDPSLVHNLTDAIINHHPAEAIKDARIVSGEMLDSYKALLKDAGVLGIFGTLLYHRLHGATERRDNILKGTEQLKPKGEQIIVLGGNRSNIVDALDHVGMHEQFIPVFESPTGVERLVETNKRRIDSYKPFYLNLGIAERNGFSYIETAEWSKLHLTRDNLVLSSKGNRYLVIVGCGEIAEEELSLDPKNVDVTHADLKSASTRLGRLFSAMDHELVEVYIGNGGMLRNKAQDGEIVYDRDLAEGSGVDIYLDTWGFVLKTIADKVPGTSNICLITTNESYVQRFQSQFSKYRLHNLVNGPDNKDDSVLLVYENTSAETFFSALRAKAMFPGRKIVAVLSNSNINNLATDFETSNMDFINASEIMACAVMRVRDLLKQGYTPEEIQKIIDAQVPPLPFRENEPAYDARQELEAEDFYYGHEVP